ncbi:MAG: polymerase [Myxococcales bacterium]|nr:polymerase [Myxococcales bacterium]
MATRYLVLFAFACGLSSRAHAETIKAIIVEDNKKTTTDTVELISQISVGDEWTSDMSTLVKQRLVTSGLFSDVEVFWDPVPGGVRVHMLVKDKHSWVIAPAFYNQPTNTGGGVGFGENNLFGLNQKLLLYGQVATGDSFFIGAWVIPSLFGSRFYSQFDTWLLSGKKHEYESPTSYTSNPHEVRESRMIYLNGGFKLGVELFRGVKIDARIRGARVSYQDVKLAPDATIDQLGPGVDPANIPKPGKEGWDVSNEFTLTIDRRANWYGVSSGHLYQFAYERGVPSLGSDFHYWEASAVAYKAVQILERHNFVLRSEVHYGHHMPFQQEFKTGGTSMRGWRNDQFRGDFKAAATAEYSLPLFTIEGVSFRGLGFWDSAYTTFLSSDNPERSYLPNAEARGLAPFKNSVGVGTRLFIRQVVIPLLGLDFGYGLESGDLQVYLAIGLTD